MYNTVRLAEMLDRYQVDALVATSRENIRYLAGFDPVIKTLRPYSGEAYALVHRSAISKVHIVHARGEADQLLDTHHPIGLTKLYGTFYRERSQSGRYSEEDEQLLAMMASESSQSGFDALIDLINALGLSERSIAIDEDGSGAELPVRLKETFPQISVKPGADAFRKIRAVKTPQEVGLLERAAVVTEGAIYEAARQAELGVSESHLARIFEIALVQGGGRPSLTMMKIGPYAVGGQRAQRADIVLGSQDILWFDCNALFQGYTADIARVFCHSATTRCKDIFAALYTGQQTAIAAIRPGMTGGDIFHLTMDAVHKAGFRDYRRHHVGHGIGLEPYERPILAPGNEDVVEEGMVLSIETPYYEFGLGALHVEDPILIGENYNTRLTQTSGNLTLLEAI